MFREQLFPILQMVRSPIVSRVEVEVPTWNRDVFMFRSQTGIIQSHTQSAFKSCIRISGTWNHIELSGFVEVQLEGWSSEN